MSFLLALIAVAIIWGAVDLATEHYRNVMREQRRINRRRKHVPYREIGFKACKPTEDMQ